MKYLNILLICVAATTRLLAVDYHTVWVAKTNNVEFGFIYSNQADLIQILVRMAGLGDSNDAIHTGYYQLMDLNTCRYELLLKKEGEYESLGMYQKDGIEHDQQFSKRQKLFAKVWVKSQYTFPVSVPINLRKCFNVHQEGDYLLKAHGFLWEEVPGEPKLLRPANIRIEMKLHLKPQDTGSDP